MALADIIDTSVSRPSTILLESQVAFIDAAQKLSMLRTQLQHQDEVVLWCLDTIRVSTSLGDEMTLRDFLGL